MEFREPVRLIWSGQMNGVEAQAVNLSPAGMLVDLPTPTPCPVGSDVLCDVALPRGTRLLRGRVAHTRPLAAANVGMGIEFIDLSPRVVAKLRDLVEGSGEEPQRVRVRFAGTNQIVSARALSTVEGFRLTTALPFLRPELPVDIVWSPDAQSRAKGWVSAVALDLAPSDGTPHLVIDVHLQDRTVLGPAPQPEPIAEPDAQLPLGADADLELEPARTPPRLDADRTEIVRFPTAPSPPKRRRGGLPAGAIAFLVVALGAGAIWLSPASVLRSLSRPSPPTVRTPPAPTSPPAVTIEPVPPPTAAVEPRAPEPAAEPSEFVVGLAGSLAGARRYPLRNPDGVAFNLPHARATMKLGTYRPAIQGLRAIWVRGLPGGGTHLRFFYSGAHEPPEVRLDSGQSRVVVR